MRKLCGNKKAVSTVISTILMIMVVMVGMSVAFAYVVFYSDNYKAGIGSSVLESLTIEDVWVQGQSVQVTVYNSGTKANLGTDVGLSVAAIYVDGSALINSQGTAFNNPNFDTIKFNVDPGQQSKYTGQVDAGKHIQFTGKSQTLTSGTHEIKVATVRGSTFKASFDVP